MRREVRRKVRKRLDKKMSNDTQQHRGMGSKKEKEKRTLWFTCKTQKKKKQNHSHWMRLQREEWLETIQQTTANKCSGSCPVPRSWALPTGQDQGYPSNVAQAMAGSGVPPWKRAPILYMHAHIQPTPAPLTPSYFPWPPGTKGDIRHSPIGLKNKRNLILQYFIS